jgi:hypothetical protein
MPKTTKSKFSLNKLNYYAMFDTGDKLDHICVMLEKIVDDLDGQDVVKVEIDNHIKALEEELEWYQQRNVEWQEKYEIDVTETKKQVNIKHNALLEYDKHWKELVEQHKTVKNENARLREQLRWHSMDELPKRMSLSCMNDLSENVILRRYIGHDIIAYYSYWKKCWQDLYTHKIVDTTICHKWCYIPEDNQGTDWSPEGE